MELTDKEKVQNMLKSLLQILAEKAEVEKSFSRLQNEAFDLYTKLNNTLEGEKQ